MLLIAYGVLAATLAGWAVYASARVRAIAIQEARRDSKNAEE